MVFAVAERYGSDPMTVQEWPEPMWQLAVERLEAESAVAVEERRKRDHEDRVRRALLDG